MKYTIYMNEILKEFKIVFLKRKVLSVSNSARKKGGRKRRREGKGRRERKEDRKKEGREGGKGREEGKEGGKRLG